MTTDSDGAQTGSWAMQWSGSGLPVFLDLVLVTKASTNWGAYLFDELLLTANPGSGDGTFEISWLNNGGKVPGLSHMSVYGRVGEGEGFDLPPEALILVPVPGSLLLLGLGVALLRVRVRARR